jgi:peptidoglycan/xylan/chitin deacetylase (PgdA/CDA1 family)
MLNMNVPILTYHSQNISGNDHAHNDHVALKEDLEALHEAGFDITPLDRVMDQIDEADGSTGDPNARQVVLTFDDGCDLDVRDTDWPGHGMQRSFLGIMQDFIAVHGLQAQAGLHATSFVIAGTEARGTIDAGSLFGQGWMSDDWWREAAAGSLLGIGNHGWDHNHPDLEGPARGNFHSVDSHAQCLLQVVHAASAIEFRTGKWPSYFAYPFGESSDYIRDSFFPEHKQLHGCRAALGTSPGFVTPESDRWNLPRFVCGRDWDSAQSLLELVS